MSLLAALLHFYTGSLVANTCFSVNSDPTVLFSGSKTPKSERDKNVCIQNHLFHLMARAKFSQCNWSQLWAESNLFLSNYYLCTRTCLVQTCLCWFGNFCTRIYSTYSMGITTKRRNDQRAEWGDEKVNINYNFILYSYVQVISLFGALWTIC